MAKKVKFESFIYCFLRQAKDKCYIHVTEGIGWREFIDGLSFRYEKAAAIVLWQEPSFGEHAFDLKSGPLFHRRGDTKRHAEMQIDLDLKDNGDAVKNSNHVFFENAVDVIAHKAGFQLKKDQMKTEDIDSDSREREFHDEWSSGEDPNSIDVVHSNEALTSPEMRYISERLGKLSGKTLLDIGCGLGEASVYFAIRGAEVTSSDISPGMLDFTQRLAQVNDVKVKTHLSSSNDLAFTPDTFFDIIYAGNLLHHVEVEETLVRAKAHLASDGVFVSWDPLAYNPVINVYRWLATEVRTVDEHPLKYGDLRLFKKHFPNVKFRYFWFFTLIIFICMTLLQFRNPNKERLWKSVVDESDHWAWLYKPLTVLDEIILSVFPPLKLLCWNVVVIASNTEDAN